MNANQKVTDYIHVFTQLQKNLKWTNKNVLMTVASIYAMKPKELHIEKFIQIADTIKGHAGLFSTMRSHPRYPAAAMLDNNFEEPGKQVPDIFRLYDDFIQAKFKRGNFTYISASILLTTDNEQVNQKEVTSRAKAIYDGMKKEHAFLTSAADYPLATLLALENRKDTIPRTEHFYEKLNQNGFRKGNNLQFLSHILSLDKEEREETLISRAIRIFDDFKHVGIKQKDMYYPVMGMLALLPTDEVNMEAISHMYEQLNKEKHFKWQKDMNVMMAVSFFVSEKLEHSGLAETSIYTTMETILQAQQAVMIATMAGASAAAASSSSN